MSNNKLLISQKVYYMELRKNGKTQLKSSKCCDISIRTGGRLDKSGILPKTIHNWQTRKDPLEEVWQLELEPLLKSTPNLQPTTLFEYLEDNHQGKYEAKILRTLQRRVKEWKAFNKSKEVIFLQKHLPGQMGISDFTLLKDIIITIKGKKLIHRLYHYRLVYSKWSYVKIILGGESYTALAEGLQSALQKSGGCPKEHRTDSLSAAFNNKKEKDELTKSYQAFCDHYQIKSTHNNLGISHENGAIESPHGHLKNRIKQTLLLRNNCDFNNIDEYQLLIDKIVTRHNCRYQSLFKEEIAHLQKLPDYQAQDFTVEHAMVTRLSTINIKRVVYSLPSRLIGEKLTIHVYDNRLEIFYNAKKTYELARIHNQGQRGHCINYRHIIPSLVKKPQAFKNFIWKEDLFPNQQFSKIWQLVNQINDSRSACKYFVKLLAVAAKLPEEQESILGEFVLKFYYLNQKLPSIDECNQEFNTKVDNNKVIPVIKSYQHCLLDYDQLLNSKSLNA
jgi:hypothetical protein